MEVGTSRWASARSTDLRPLLSTTTRHIIITPAQRRGAEEGRERGIERGGIERGRDRERDG